ncbi:MAG: oligosaccharide flippase family protein, partial [Bdellovibrionales bacterium]|nr:oligosaccharide flippase family protein [Bdellovibrionales bacterium]
MENSFLKNVLKLVTSTAMGQGLQLLLLPFVVYLYGPSSFGAFSFSIAIVGVIAPVASLRYDQAVITHLNPGGSLSLYKISCWIAILTSILVTALLYFADVPLTEYFRMPELSGILWSTGVLVFLEATFNAQRSWLVKNEAYSEFAVLQLIRV